MVILAIDQNEDEQTVRTFSRQEPIWVPYSALPSRQPGDRRLFRFAPSLPWCSLIRAGWFLIRVGYASDTEEALRLLAKHSGPDYVPPQLAETTPAGVYSVGGDVTEPVPIYKPDPPYSEEARRCPGTVLLWIVVDCLGGRCGLPGGKTPRPRVGSIRLKQLKTWKLVGCGHETRYASTGETRHGVSQLQVVGKGATCSP